MFFITWNGDLKVTSMSGIEQFWLCKFGYAVMRKMSTSYYFYDEKEICMESVKQYLILCNQAEHEIIH